MIVQSYTEGTWHLQGNGSDLISAVTGKPVAQLVEADLDYQTACKYARQKAGPVLREMSFHERAFKIKFLAQYLIARKEDYYKLSTHTGATRQASWIDIGGGIGGLFALSIKAR